MGEDQLPHLELTREIVRRFHHLYGKEIFPEPEAVLTPIPRVPGLDGRKMSKSYGNCIDLSDTREEVIRKVKTQMVTDPARKRKEDKGIRKCPVFLQVFNPKKTEAVAHACRNASRGCVDCKMEMCEKLNLFMDPVRERRKTWMSKQKEIREILDKGAVKARSVARQTLTEVSKAMGLLA